MASTSVYPRIYALVKRIPRGRVATYGQIAALIERCTPRMVGYAMAALPPDSGVPWHRVINAQGKVSERAGGDGSLQQAALLRSEGVRFDSGGRVDLDRLRWKGPRRSGRARALSLLALGFLVLGLPGCGPSPGISIPPDRDQVGVASYYADKFQGRTTASGEIYDMNEWTAAHPSLPFGTRVRVVNLVNDRRVVLRINDRGPFVKGRIIDVSYRAARELDFIRAGTVRVRVEVLPEP
jgi:rare lipoprotein A